MKLSLASSSGRVLGPLAQPGSLALSIIVAALPLVILAITVWILRGVPPGERRWVVTEWVDALRGRSDTRSD